MEYSDFDIEDFLADESFQQYCSGRNAESIQIWTAWLSHHPEKRKQIENAKKIYFVLNGNLNHHTYQKHINAFKARLLDHIDENEEAVRTLGKKRFAYKPLLVAASIAAIIFSIGVLFFTHSFPFNTSKDQFSYSTLPGEKKSIKLPDGTVVILNSASRISYSENFNITDRKVELTGEAYFKVVHNRNRQFTVHTAKMDIKDIGTVFNVKAYPEDKYTEASLIEGAIELVTTNKGAVPIQILPKQKVIINNDLTQSVVNTPAKLNTSDHQNLLLTNVNANRQVKTIVETDWINNRLTFNDENFEEIATRMERWYNVKISFENQLVKKYRFVATFDNKGLNQVLEVLKLSHDFNYRKEDDMIVIY